MKNIITLIIIQISLTAMGQDIMTPAGYEKINQNCHKKTFANRDLAVIEACNLLYLYGYQKDLTYRKGDRVYLFEPAISRNGKHVYLVILFDNEGQYELTLTRIKNQDTNLFSYQGYDGAIKHLVYLKRTSMHCQFKEGSHSIMHKGAI